MSLCEKCGYLPLITVDAQIPEPVPTEILSVNQQLGTKMVLETLSVANSKLASLDAEINRIANALDKLRQRREELHAFAMTHASLIAPIRQLPAELLYLIILHHMDLERPSLSATYRLDRTPLILASVAHGEVPYCHFQEFGRTSDCMCTHTLWLQT